RIAHAHEDGRRRISQLRIRRCRRAVHEAQVNPFHPPSKHKDATMPFDYSQADNPRDFSELIPHGTIATVQMHIRPGGVGEDEMLKRTANGDAEMLECEFVVLDGPHARRKFWGNFLLEGTTPGQQEMARSNRGLFKNILESARGIKKGDGSEQARAAYQASLKDFDNIIFIAKIGIEKGGLKKDGSGEKWPDKNYPAAAI